MESEFSPDSPRFLSSGCIRPYDTPGRYIDDWRVGLTNQQLRMIIEGNRLMKAGRYRAALDLMKRATSGINIQLKPKLRDNIEKLQVFVDRENEVYKQQILSQHPQHEIDDERYRTVKALQRLSMAKLQSERLGNPCIKPQEDLMENVAMEQISRSMHVRPGVNKKEIAKDVFKRLNDMIEEYAPHKIEFHLLHKRNHSGTFYQKKTFQFHHASMCNRTYGILKLEEGRYRKLAVLHLPFGCSLCQMYRLKNHLSK